MALLPIAWNFQTIPIKRDIGNGKKSKLKPIFDYPACHSLGIVFRTSFTLKIYLDKHVKRNWKAATPKAICIEIERFCDLSALSIQGSVSLHETNTHRRVGLKAFQHLFKEGEKSFVFQMNMIRCGHPFSRIFSDLSLHGHICVDSSKNDGVLTNTEDSDVFCPVPQIHKSYSLLSNDFRHMLDDHCFSDVTLNCAGEKFSVHKSVLSSRSPVFKAMFESNMKESRSDEIPISDVEPAALRALLNYMYCGKIDDLSASVACNLLYAADKYDLPVLKDNCVSFLKTAMSLDNVCLILNSAVLHDESLKAIVYNYVFENATTILNTEEWKAIEKVQPYIYRDILLNSSNRGSKSRNQGTAAL